MKNFLFVLTLILTVGIFSSCEKEECKTCTLNLAWLDSDVEAAFDLIAVADGYASAQDEAEQDLEEEGVSFGEVCGDEIQTSKDNYEDFMDGVYGLYLDDDDIVDVTWSYTCE
tara:strand:+ start:188 stop:526 length:339 start_codon:yes stop_codon:yes gene_type:complete